jgi:hypothetical protein
VRSFGGIKGLLTFEDIKSKKGDDYDKSEFKTGCVIKCYCLFKKKDQGLALTLSKKKAKAEDNVKEKSTQNIVLPTEQEIEEMGKKYNLR